MLGSLKLCAHSYNWFEENSAWFEPPILWVALRFSLKPWETFHQSAVDPTISSFLAHSCEVIKVVLCKPAYTNMSEVQTSEVLQWTRQPEPVFAPTDRWTARGPARSALRGRAEWSSESAISLHAFASTWWGPGVFGSHVGSEGPGHGLKLVDHGRVGDVRLHTKYCCFMVFLRSKLHGGKSTRM